MSLAFCRSTMNGQKIFEDDHIKVFHQPGSSFYRTISFAPLNFDFRSNDFWGRSLGLKLDLDIVGFVAKGKNWYPSSSIDRAAQMLRERLSSKQVTLTYGTSMGGYAAIKHSRTLGASSAIALSPQFSIDPEDVQLFDTRFTQHFNPMLHKGMRISKEDVACSPYIFFDPLYKQDQLNVEHITKSLSNSISMPQKNTHHATIELFSSSEAAQDLLNFAAYGKTHEIEALAHKLRRRSFIRRRQIATWVAERSFTKAQSILLAHPTPVKAQDLAAAHFEIGESCMRQGQIIHAASAFLAAYKTNPRIEKYAIRAAQTCTRAKAINETIHIVNSALPIHSSSSHFLNAIAGIQIELGHIKEARATLLKAISINLHPDFVCRLIRVNIRLKRLEEAICLAKLAEQTFPLNPSCQAAVAEALSLKSTVAGLDFISLEQLPSSD